MQDPEILVMVELFPTGRCKLPAKHPELPTGSGNHCCLVSTAPWGWVGDLYFSPAVFPDVVNIQIVIQVRLQKGSIHLSQGGQKGSRSAWAREVGRRSQLLGSF